MFGHLETKKAKALAVIEEVGELELRDMMGGDGCVAKRRGKSGVH